MIVGVAKETRAGERRVALVPDAAKQLATMPLGPLSADGDTATMAAWTVVANVLLNLDQALTRP